MQIAKKEVQGKPLQKRDERNDGTFLEALMQLFVQNVCILERGNSFTCIFFHSHGLESSDVKNFICIL